MSDKWIGDIGGSYESKCRKWIYDPSLQKLVCKKSKGKKLRNTRIPGLFNTGQALNPGPLGVPYPSGDEDVNFELLAPGSTEWVNAHVGGSPYWLPNDTDSTWIGWNYDIGLHRARTSFSLYNYLPGSVSITFEFLVDESLNDVYLNGISQGISSSRNRTIWQGPFTINDGFQNGMNTLEFEFNCVAESESASGIRIKITGTGISYI